MHSAPELSFIHSLYAPPQLLAGGMGLVHTGFRQTHGPNMIQQNDKVLPSQEEIDEESRRVRRLRIIIHLALDTIASGSLSPEEAAEITAGARRVALELFPGKENAFDLIYRPQFQRLMNEVYRLQ